ncbi:MAG: hypothetical protein FWH27_04395, partial [Planctomycetaceae bacterium]|nr:hypothetical protein [Planctomycetaceae bacterium]
GVFRRSLDDLLITSGDIVVALPAYTCYADGKSCYAGGSCCYAAGNKQNTPMILTKRHSFREYPPCADFFARPAISDARTTSFNAQRDYAGEKVQNAECRVQLSKFIDLIVT